MNLINDFDAELYHELALAFECARLPWSCPADGVTTPKHVALLGRQADSRLPCRYAWHMIFGEPPVLVAMPECDMLTCDGAKAH